MDDRTSRPEISWPVALGEVLDVLRSDDEIEIDLGAAGILLVRWAPPSRTGREVVSTPGPPPLTERSLRVLQLVAEGLPAAVVADSLAAPIADVAAELADLRARYAVESTAAAVEAARRAGDLPPDRQIGRSG